MLSRANAAIVVVLLSAAGSTPAGADRPIVSTSETNAPATTWIADLGLHVIGVGYQRNTSRYLALQVDLDFYTPWTQNINFFGLSDDLDGSDVTGGVVRARPIVFVHGTGPRGLWVSPFVQAGIVKATTEDVQEVGMAWALGASVGYTLALNGRWSLAMGLGGQYHGARIGDTSPPNFQRFYPHLDGTINWTPGG